VLGVRKGVLEDPDLEYSEMLMVGMRLPVTKESTNDACDESHGY
jgi:hypothetical protein